MSAGDDMFSGTHDEDEPCDGCGKRPSVSMGHGSYSCEACFEARWCPECRYSLGADPSKHVCPSPEVRAENARIYGYFRRDMDGTETYGDACLRLDLEVRDLTASLAEARERLARYEEWPADREGDRPIPEDAAIEAAFPTRSKSYATYDEAMRMVGAKRSKGALVALVNWLLVTRAAALAAKGAT